LFNAKDLIRSFIHFSNSEVNEEAMNLLQCPVRTSILNEASKPENIQGVSSYELAVKINKRHKQALDGCLVNTYLEKLVDREIMKLSKPEGEKEYYVLTLFGKKVYSRMRRIIGKMYGPKKKESRSLHLHSVLPT
jgi:hypothetical protein